MTAGDSDTPGAAPYSDATRARLELAFAAYELAELARAAVPIAEREPPPDATAAHAAGATLSEAAQVLTAAQRFFEAAAVFERLSGADWQAVGDTLNVSAHTARTRFAASEARFRAVQDPNESRGEASWWRPYLSAEPLEAARDLDDWVLRHADGDDGLGATPVSGALVRGADPAGPGFSADP